LAGIQEEIQNGIDDNLDHIVLCRELLIAEDDRISVLEKACKANYVTLIEGWVPESELQVVFSKLRGMLDYVFLDSRRPKPLEEPPTKLKNPSGIRPFQVIGGPSTSIAVDELAQLGVRTLIRVGTTGTIQPYVNVGDVIITSGSVRLD
jgi:hypothetical protein